MDAWKITNGGTVVVVPARTEEEALVLAGVDPMPSRRPQSITVTRCEPGQRTTNGKVKDCCQEPINLSWVAYGEGMGMEMAMCSVCSCRHFRDRLEPATIKTKA